jgi:hypothetical protein
MAITPIEDLFTHRLHQSYDQSIRVGGSCENIPRRRYKVAHDAVNLLKRLPLLLVAKIRQLLFYS